MAQFCTVLFTNNRLCKAEKDSRGRGKVGCGEAGGGEGSNNLDYCTVDGKRQKYSLKKKFFGKSPGTEKVLWKISPMNRVQKHFG